MTDVTAVRTLIGDQNSVDFTDDEIAMFNQLAGVNGPGAEYFFAAAIALESLASKKGANLQEVRIGDFMDSSGRNQVKSLLDAADGYKKMFYETPAWAVAELNVSDFNALVMIRNYVLRTTP